jgi:hypothetical protein
VKVRVVDGGVALDGGSPKSLHADRVGIGDRERNPGVGLDVLELPREENARGQIDDFAVVERDQRMRDGSSSLVQDGELTDQGRVQ